MAIEIRDGVAGKVCRDCGEWVEIEGFSRKADTADGRRGYCRKCQAGDGAIRARDPNRKCAGCGAVASETPHFPVGSHCGACIAVRLRNPDRKCSGCGVIASETEHFPLGNHCGACAREDALAAAPNRRAGGAWYSSQAAANTRRRARVRGAEGEYTAEETDLLKFVYGTTCPACKSRPVGHIDHVEPLAGAERNDWNGTNWVDNLQWLCVPCNLTKSDKNDNDFRPDGGAAARAVLRLELYKVRNTRDRKLYTLWIKRRLEPYTTLEARTSALQAISVRDAYEVGKLVRGIILKDSIKEMS